MDANFLARLQFGLTIGFHYIFPPMSIGLGLVLVVMEAFWLKTRKEVYRRMTRFWATIFGLIFAVGVATGIVMEFQFGTNWSTYSRFVGDVFGSALAAEGIFAFFLESGFLAVVLFGWDRVRPGWHFFATVMVALGSVFSAVWIVVANSWQQTPAGHRLVEHAAGQRAETVDFWAMVFNPSSLDRLSHVLMGAWQAGAFLVLSVSAYYILKKRHIEIARTGIKIALVVAVVGAVLQLVTGHQSAQGVARHQPAKLAALEGHFAKSAPADMYLVGWVHEEEERTSGLRIPGFLSFLVHGDSSTPVPGLKAWPPRDRPPANAVFQSYHVMVIIGMGLIGLSLIGLFAWWRGWLFESRWLLWLFVISVVGPAAANQLGWFTAEVGRQPWIVYGLLRTADASSPAVSAAKVTASLVLFGLIYLLLLAVFIYLLDHKIKHGPAEPEVLASPGAAGAGMMEHGR
jgi:cytochrome d ubiquinol oxidase subunit I